MKMDEKALIKALSSKAVADVIKQVFEQSFSGQLQELHNAMIQLRKEVNGAVADMRKELSTLSGSVVALKSEVTDLSGSVATLKSELVNLEDKMEALEIQARADNLVFKGIPETFADVLGAGTLSASGVSETTASPNGETADGTLSCVLNFIQQKLQPDIVAGDISTAFRVRKMPYDKHRPIIVRFASRRMRDQVYAARRKLWRQTPRVEVYVNEMLTKRNSDLFATCRKLWKQERVSSSWTQNGAVFIKQLPSKGSKAVKIRDEAHLNDVI
jgi:hypothetical protein